MTRHTRSPRRLARLGAAVLLAGAAVAGCSAKAGEPVTAPSPHAWHGVEPQPVPERPSFTLTDTSGRTFDFAKETAGRPTFVYFGYTNCPDECPTAMADIAAALRSGPAELREQTKVILVTTDPARDTAPVLRRWLDSFSTVHLLGTPAQVDAAQRAAGIQPAEKQGPIKTLPASPTSTSTSPAP